MRLSALPLTASGAMALLARTLVPAGKVLSELRFSGCALSPMAMHLGGELASVSYLQLSGCAGAALGGSPAAALDVMLQHMPGVQTVHIVNCDFSGGLPYMLRQLRNITRLTLHSTQLASLPALACMPGESVAEPRHVVCAGMHHAAGHVCQLAAVPMPRCSCTAHAGLEWLDLSGNQFAWLPSLGSAPKLGSLNLQSNPNMAMDAAAVDRLAAEAPNLWHLDVGGAILAGVRLAHKLPRLKVT